VFERVSRWNSTHLDGLPLIRGAAATAPIESKLPKILMIVEDQVILAMELQCELEEGGYLERVREY
jgi:hypothetical protein